MKTKVLFNLFLLVSLTWLSSCGVPVPADKMDYVGEWQAPNMYLSITADGRVKYKRKKGSMTKSIDAPLQGFDRNDFIVGVGSLKTTFRVDKPPYEDNGQWKMIVDGVTLTRTRKYRSNTI